MEKVLNYKGKTCKWFKDCGCLFFAFPGRDYMQYDVRALNGLKKQFKDGVNNGVY